MNNYIDVYFKDNNDKVGKLVTGLWKWDFGQVLRIHGLNLPADTEFQFAIDSRSTTETVIGRNVNGVIEVDIPDYVFQEETEISYNVTVYVYVKEGNAASTEYTITLVVWPRPKRPIAVTRQ